MRFYEFVDKAPPVGRLAIVEGTERVLADRAVEILLDRILPRDLRDLNLQRVAASDFNDSAKLSEALQAMPFLAERRVVVFTDAQTLRAESRRQLWEAAQTVPDGNTLLVTDLLSPRSQRPQPLGSLAGRSALRIDTTASEETRERFVKETLADLRAAAERRVVDALVRSESDLASVRNDLEKLALGGKKIAYADLERESLTIEDPKAYKYASALVEGRTAEAFGIAAEMFANEPRGAAIPLVSALATECGLLWESARPGGSLPARAKWRERFLRPVAARIGEGRARAAYERAVRGFESIVTGRVDDPRLVVEMLTAELAQSLSAAPVRVR